MKSSRTSTIPHGRSAFAEHQCCSCATCRFYRDAVRRLVDSFSQVPARWISELSAHYERHLPLPIWGTLFIPTEVVDRHNIERLLRSVEAEDEDLDPLTAAGWQELTETGILAVEFDGELLLGIHGGGYDFYREHWSKLYDALDYRWHESR